MGSQQSRFLLVPICLMIILTISYLPKLSKVFMVLIVMALGVEVISLVNANRHDWGKSYAQVLRVQDQKLLEIKPSAPGIEVELNEPDIAYASFPVTVHQDNSAYVIPHG